MAKESGHGKAIAAAAGLILSPLGFTRRGRSRIWIADEGFWFATVEFQPSGFAKGSYLNLAASWLWSLRDHDHIAFDHFERLEPYADLEGSSPLGDEIRPLTICLVPAIQSLRDRFRSLPSVDDHLARRAREDRASLHDHCHAAISAGLVGDAGRSRAAFDKVASHEARAEWEFVLQARMAELALRLDPISDFAGVISSRIESARTQMRMTPAAYGFPGNGLQRPLAGDAQSSAPT